MHIWKWLWEVGSPDADADADAVVLFINPQGRFEHLNYCWRIQKVLEHDSIVMDHSLGSPVLFI